MKTLVKFTTLSFSFMTTLVATYIAMDYIKFCKNMKKTEQEELVHYVTPRMEDIDIEV